MISTGLSHSRGLGWLVISLLVSGMACGGKDGPKRVGSTCSETDICGTAPGQACILAWPDGYCTEYPCELGSCASGAVCVRGIQFLNVPQSNFCMASCAGDLDCRDGYHCASISGDDRICTPTNR